MSTIHNPSQFQPQDYVVVDYFDNRPPEYVFGMPAEAFRAEREWHMKERSRLFPELNCYRCEHCGQGNVRYVVAVDHVPTGKRVCFGQDCVVRLDFPNQDAFKAAQLRARAEQKSARLAIWKKRLAFLEQHPEVQGLIDEAAKPAHAENHFVKDVLAKLDQYGSLSERQIEGVRKSLAIDNERQKAKENDTRPVLKSSERAVREGVVISLKTQESQFGTTFKMLVQLDDGNRIFGTEPSSPCIRKGDRIQFSAPIEVSDRDPHFGFFTRPTKCKVLVPASQPAQAAA